MKKLFSAMLSALLILSLAACGSSAGTQSTASSESSASTSSAAETAAPTEEPTATPEPTEAPSDKPTIEETVLLDSDDVKVTATALGDTYLKITVENNTDKDIYVQTADSSVCVNDYVMNSMCMASAAAGETVDNTIEFTKYDLEEIGIETITELEVALNVVDSTDWTSICSSDPVVIKTSAYSTAEAPAAPEGEVLYDEGGIKLVMLGTTEYEGDSFYFPTRVKFYIENNSENNITVDPLDLNVNGQLTQGGISFGMSDSIPAGKRAVTELHFDADACKTNGITELKDVSFTFSVKDAKSWDGLAQSDTISLTF